ncbi:MAG: hypothetical protein ACXVBW_04290 [Bdellovibrionota bacterium]
MKKFTLFLLIAFSFAPAAHAEWMEDKDAKPLMGKTVIDEKGKVGKVVEVYSHGQLKIQFEGESGISSRYVYSVKPEIPVDSTGFYQRGVRVLDKKGVQGVIEHVFEGGAISVRPLDHKSAKEVDNLTKFDVEIATVDGRLDLKSGQGFLDVKRKNVGHIIGAFKSGKILYQIEGSDKTALVDPSDVNKQVDHCGDFVLGQKVQDQKSRPQRYGRVMQIFETGCVLNIQWENAKGMELAENTEHINYLTAPDSLVKTYVAPAPKAGEVAAGSAMGGTSPQLHTDVAASAPLNPPQDDPGIDDPGIARRLVAASAPAAPPAVASAQSAPAAAPPAAPAAMQFAPEEVHKAPAPAPKLTAANRKFMASCFRSALRAERKGSSDKALDPACSIAWGELAANVGNLFPKNDSSLERVGKDKKLKTRADRTAFDQQCLADASTALRKKNPKLVTSQCLDIWIDLAQKYSVAAAAAPAADPASTSGAAEAPTAKADVQPVARVPESSTVVAKANSGATAKSADAPGPDAVKTGR